MGIFIQGMAESWFWSPRWTVSRSHAVSEETMPRVPHPDDGSCCGGGTQEISHVPVPKSSENRQTIPPGWEPWPDLWQPIRCEHLCLYMLIIEKVLFVFQVPVLFDEVAIYFSDEEWEVLTEQQKALYREVMRMNYEIVLSLGNALFSFVSGKLWTQRPVSLSLSSLLHLVSSSEWDSPPVLCQLHSLVLIWAGHTDGAFLFETSR